MSVYLKSFAVILAAVFLACGPSGSGEDCETGGVPCGDACVDTASDPLNCGGCNIECAAGDSCTAGQCVTSQVCDPGATESCYTGPTGTEGVGECTGGTRECQTNGTWGTCAGEVRPVTEVCGNNADDDCNSIVDDEADNDGDGWTNCEGDCCDTPGPGCADPELVNPGAYEAAGNEVDDDCDGMIDNPITACDTALMSNSGNAMDYALAMDLCQQTVENPPDDERRWGVISAEFTLTNGSGNPNASARAIRTGFGSGTSTQLGDSMVMMSTGTAAAPGDVSPAHAAFQGGQDLGLTSPVPGDWLAANGNNFPNAPGCPEPQGGATANDPIMLKLRIRAPSNARSFSLSSKFFSSEYPEWVCSAFNDFFVVLLDSTFTGMPANPSDKNLARYTAPNMSDYPVGVNLAFGDTGLFQACLNGPTGCGGGSVAGNTTTCVGAGELAGTGMDVANPPSQFLNDPGWCGASNLAGGGTGWLTTSGNVDPGEVIELRFAMWDTGDPWYDSVVLLDNFQWSVEASEPGTIID